MQIKSGYKSVSKTAFITMVSHGFAASDIAKEFSISRPTVMKIAKQLDLYDELRASGRKKQVEHCQTVRIKLGDNSNG